MARSTPDDEEPADATAARGKDAVPHASDPEPVVSWSVAPTDTRLGRLATYVLTGSLGGFVLLLVGVTAVVSVSAALSGNWRALAVAVVLVAFAGPVSVIPLVVFLDADQRPDLDGPLGRLDLDALHPLGILASALLGAGALVAGFASGVVGTMTAIVGPILLSTVAFAVVAPEGALDVDAGTLTLHDRTHSLADLTSVRTYAVADIVVVRPQFAARPGGRDAPFAFTMQASDYDRVATAFAEGVAADAETADPQSTGERVALAVVGVGALALAGGLVAIGATSTTDGSEILYWVGSLPGLFGVAFLWLAFGRGN